MGDQVANHLTVGLVKSIKYAYTKYQISLFSLMLTIREKENKVTNLQNTWTGENLKKREFGQHLHSNASWEVEGAALRLEMVATGSVRKKLCTLYVCALVPAGASGACLVQTRAISQYYWLSTSSSQLEQAAGAKWCWGKSIHCPPVSVPPFSTEWWFYLVLNGPVSIVLYNQQ